MYQQLKPYYSNRFICDNCQEEFRQTTAYAPHPNLKITYCADCKAEIEAARKVCSFREVDDKTKKYMLCDKPTFDKKKQLCRSHNYQVRKRFNEFTKDMSIGSTAAWEMAWEQSGSWRYFWNLGKDREKTTQSKPAPTNKHWNKIQKKSLGEVPQEASQNLQAPELAPSDKRITGRTKQLNLKVKEQTYWKLKEFALKEKCLMTEILEKALEGYEKQRK